LCGGKAAPCIEEQTALNLKIREKYTTRCNVKVTLTLLIIKLHVMKRQEK
jgi:hypothetical protein